MQVAARTEIGRVRKRNEDALLVTADERLLVVCDGLGGHPAGDVASATAIESLRSLAAGASSSSEALVQAVHDAHEAVLAAADQDPRRQEMATTVVLAAVGDEQATVVHVGDSRAYVLGPDGRFQQVTRDHGLGGYITQALGLGRGVAPDVAQVALPPGSRLLLCSDGLSNMVDAPGIAELLGDGDAGSACDALVEKALDNGGIDNVTVVVAVS